MIGIKSVVYEKNGNSFIINIDDESKFLYQDISRKIDNDLVFEYLKNLFNLIESWENEYINTQLIDSDSWKLAIIYTENTKKEYSGKGNYPTNFESFERLNQKLIEEVQNGRIGF